MFSKMWENFVYRPSMCLRLDRKNIIVLRIKKKMPCAAKNSTSGHSKIKKYIQLRPTGISAKDRKVAYNLNNFAWAKG